MPGAASNTPPGASSAPINGQAPQLTAGSGNGGAGGASKRESTTNYEVDKTVRVTRNASGAVRRLSAAVVVNASTRFTDGGEFGFGAEIGISTQKLHARGPMGLPEMTSSKYVVIGDGHVR